MVLPEKVFVRQLFHRYYIDSGHVNVSVRCGQSYTFCVRVSRSSYIKLYAFHCITLCKKYDNSSI